MNKSELVDKVAKQADMSKKDATRVIDAVFGVIVDALCEGEKVQIVGFGTFEPRRRAPREARNPQTNETIQIPEARVPAFRPGKQFKNLVNQVSNSEVSTENS